ncbi:LPS assembly lipoprotein LptE [Pseudomonas viridiflava]|uniref:LPS-assembly lipoprotein LptE n=1 Tax=Pseudomonas viridiflava TaxID=33069 RepID=UPI000F0607C9|nr:LPS assembly lipoprotein LptE [Pseudomonas viridiflava]
MIKRNLLVMGLAVLLSACGFQLRGTGENQLSIKELDLSARDAYGKTVVQLRQVLEGNGVKIYTGAPYKLAILDEQETQRKASSGGAGRAAEYTLNTTLNYEIKGSQNRQLLQRKIQIEKIYVHDGNNLTGSDLQAVQVRNEMRSDLIQNLMAQLQQLTPAQLDELQAKADAVAKAEADALEAAQRIRDETPQQSPIEIPSR